MHGQALLLLLLLVLRLHAAVGLAAGALGAPTPGSEELELASFRSLVVEEGPCLLPCVST